MITKIVLDGAPGSGKTTLLQGRGHEDPSEIDYCSLAGRGLVVFPECFTEVAREMRLEGIEPLQNLQEVFRRFVERQSRRHLELPRDGKAFFDKGFPGYMFLAKHFGQNWGDDFYSALGSLAYDSPIFILEPIKNFDLSIPRNPQRARVFTWEERVRIHDQIARDYSSLGYNIIEVPALAPNPQVSTRLRLEYLISQTGC